MSQWGAPAVARALTVPSTSLLRPQYVLRHGMQVRWRGRVGGGWSGVRERMRDGEEGGGGGPALGVLLRALAVAYGHPMQSMV